MSASAEGRPVGRMEFGDHLCLSYDNDDERLAVLRAYVRDGLAADHKIIYLSDQDPPETVLGWLGAREAGTGGYAGFDPAPGLGPDLVRALEDGRFVVRTAEEAYLATGRFDPDEIIGLFATEIEMALVQGYKGVRVTGEETFSLRGWPGTERFAEFERKIDEVFRTSRVNAMAICQYDRRWFDAERLDRLEAHHVDRVRPDPLHDDGTFRVVPLFGPPGLGLAGTLTPDGHTALERALDSLPRTAGLVCVDLSALDEADEEGLRLVVGKGVQGGIRRQVLLRGVSGAVLARLRAADLHRTPGVEIEEGAR
ncbi:MEDS domain-containing protein [Actinomadura kijaniata]|uniref:MEDS domain-containing protein n=1 Tax=Actinomadura kijaniata TaxID=46161 RepID=UPI0008326CC0|nr:MEDS domain-containing protein [Actinomadura kijaniata]